MRIHWTCLMVVLLAGCTSSQMLSQHLKLNEIQTIGSHNSYKLAMSPEHAAALKQTNPQAAAALEYWHLPIGQQLDLGLRALELDIFYDPDAKKFVVGHVQVIDMNTTCSPLRRCLEEIRAWSDEHLRHLPITIMFNAKDQVIEGLPDPVPFDTEAFDLLDGVFTDVLGARLIQPDTVGAGDWPTLDEARGRFLVLLDEGGLKRDLYAAKQKRPIFMNLSESDPRAAIMVINDPIKDFARIQQAVRAGYVVRTRADSDTVEARANDRTRFEAALKSGAQIISTDYYQPATHFGNDYQVGLDAPAICNETLVNKSCSIDDG